MSATFQRAQVPKTGHHEGLCESRPKLLQLQKHCVQAQLPQRAGAQAVVGQNTKPHRVAAGISGAPIAPGSDFCRNLCQLAAPGAHNERSGRHARPRNKEPKWATAPLSVTVLRRCPPAWARLVAYFRGGTARGQSPTTGHRPAHVMMGTITRVSAPLAANRPRWGTGQSDLF